MARKIDAVSDQKWDLLISHASEDKRAFVVPLAVAPTAFGVNIWYGEHELRLGDGLTRISQTKAVFVG
jgi:hypothetical protein